MHLLGMPLSGTAQRGGPQQPSQPWPVWGPARGSAGTIPFPPAELADGLPGQRQRSGKTHPRTGHVHGKEKYLESQTKVSSKAVLSNCKWNLTALQC